MDLRVDITRPRHYIGNGKYVVHYRDYVTGHTKTLIGICENFNPNGLSVFWNKDTEQILLVQYEHIIGVYPVE